MTSGMLCGAKTFRRTYLAECRNVLTNPTQVTMNADISADEPENMSGSARLKLAAQSGDSR